MVVICHLGNSSNRNIATYIDLADKKGDTGQSGRKSEIGVIGKGYIVRSELNIVNQL